MADKQIATAQSSLPAASSGGEVMALLKSAMDQGHSVEVIERLLDMQERIMRTQAQQAYAQAMHRVQSTVTPVRMAGYNEHTKKRYGRLEEMWAELRPLLDQNGFSLSFGEADGQQNKLRIACTVMHVGGHSEQYHLDLPADSSGSKNAIQGIGSTTTYGRRYLTGMIFGVVFTSEDDDGIGGEVEKISEQQALDIRALMNKIPKKRADGMLHWLKVSKVGDIPLAKYKAAVDALERVISEVAQ